MMVMVVMVTMMMIFDNSDNNSSFLYVLLMFWVFLNMLPLLIFIATLWSTIILSFLWMKLRDGESK